LGHGNVGEGQPRTCGCTLIAQRGEDCQASSKELASTSAVALRKSHATEPLQGSSLLPAIVAVSTQFQHLVEQHCSVFKLPRQLSYVAKPPEAIRYDLCVSVCAADRKCVHVPRPSCGKVAQVVGHETSPCQDLGPRDGLVLPPEIDDPLEQVAGLHKMAARMPEFNQRSSEALASVQVAALEQPLECGA
jgi:hypothetical protein